MRKPTQPGRHSHAPGAGRPAAPSSQGEHVPQRQTRSRFVRGTTPSNPAKRAEKQRHAPARGQQPTSTRQAPTPGRKSAFRRAEADIVSAARRHQKPGWMGEQKATTPAPTSVSRPAAFISIAIVVLLFVVTVLPPLYTWYQEKQSYRDVHAQLVAAKAENKELKQQLQRWNDPDYINAEARERLGYVKPGDTQYVVEGLPPKKESAATTTPPRPWFMIVTDSVAAAGQNKPTKAAGGTKDSPAGIPADGAVEHKEKKNGQ